MRVGLEVEVGNIARQPLEGRLRSCIDRDLDWTLHDDGSIRTNNFMIDGVPITPISVRGQAHYPAGAQRVDNYGPEIVSGILRREQAERLAPQLSEVLCKMPFNSRASIHVHQSGFHTWQHIQNLVAWYYHLEAPLMRLAGLGKRHRGEMLYQQRGNDHRYARPLSQPIFMFDRAADRMVPSIDVPKMLQAKNFGDFLYHWGRLDHYWADGELAHYCPQRLHMINLASLLRYRTVETRMWNGVFAFLPDALAVTLRLYDLAEAGTPDFEPMLIGSKPSVTAADISKILDMDIEHIWGVRWPNGCETIDRVSHYSNNDLPIATPKKCTWHGED